MESTLRVSPVASVSLWTGRILSGVVIVFLLFDGIIKLIPIAPVIESMQQLGYGGDVTPVARGLGVLTLAIVVLYALPRTAILGAILLTGLLGGAMATHCALAARFSRICCSACILA